MARQVALNSIVSAWEEGRLELSLLPDMQVLLTADNRQAIRQAMEARLGVSLTLELRTCPELPWETPAQAEARQAEQRRQAVIDAIRRDPLTEELGQRFGAELVEASVRELRSL